MEWLRRAMVYIAVGSAGLVTVLAIAAFTPRKWSFPADYACEITVYISSDGFHTNFFVPVETSVFNWRQYLNLDQIAHRPSQDYRYLQFGWGDRIFYIETPSWDQVHPTNALRALFYWHNRSALFIKGHPKLPPLPNEQMKCVKLSQADYLALVQLIQDTFARDNQAQPQRLASGQDQESGFFAAQGYYSVLNTCNSWTANGLRAANVNTPLWAGLAQPVMQQLRNGCVCEVGRSS
jgi:uncharacterized protein (TIGR02117 family)